MKAFDWAISQPWAMTEEMLRLGLEIAMRENDPPEVIENRTGKRLENTHEVSYREVGDQRVAVIPVVGPIFRYANAFYRISGGVSSEILANDIRAAVEDPSIAAVVLSFDSPGGQATSIAELASQIREYTKVKPIIAYGDGTVASGAYWLAAAASKFVVSKTAALGSIGVVATMRKPDPNSRTVEIVSSGAPLKRLDVTTEAGRAEIQREVDALHDVFVAEVARFRGVSRATVERDFGQGGVRIGADAVKHKMADEVGSFESLILSLVDSESSVRNRRSSVFSMSRGNGMDWKIKLMERLFSRDDAGEEDTKETQEASGTAAVVETLKPIVVRHDTAEADRLRAEIETYRKKDRERRLADIAASAERFAGAQVSARRVLPAETELVMQVYAGAALADAGITAMVEVSDGKLAITEGDVAFGLTKAVEDLFAKRPPHQYTEEVLKNAVALAAEDPNNNPYVAAEDDDKTAEAARKAASRYFQNRGR